MEQVAHVYVNEIEVGALPVGQYQEIVKKVRQMDLRRFFGEAVNVGRMLLRFIQRLLENAVWAALLLFVLQIFLDVEGAKQLVLAFRVAPLEQVIGFLRMFIASVLCLSGIFGLLDFIARPRRFGYENQVDVAVNRAIREILEVPAEGDMRVIIPERSVQNEQQA